MIGARSFAFAAGILCICALVALAPAAAPAQTIDFSLNVFYTTPSNLNSGGTWELVAKSSNFGLAGVHVNLSHIASATLEAPRATVNTSDGAGFYLFTNTPQSGYRELTIAQVPDSSLSGAEEQGLFYGVGQPAFTNGAPNYPGKPPTSSFEGPVFTSLTSPLDIPWAAGDAFGSSAWDTAARFASGTFTAGANSTPSFVFGASGNVFTSIGSSTTAGSMVFVEQTVSNSDVTTIVRTNFAPSADYNHNGIVDAADYVIWRKQNNTSVTPSTGADGTGDGLVNQADYNLWRDHFGNPSGAGSGGSLSTGAVPEPMTGALAAVGVFLYACIRRRPFSRDAKRSAGPQRLS